MPRDDSLTPPDRTLTNRIESALMSGRLDQAASLLHELHTRIDPASQARYDAYQAYYLALWGDVDQAHGQFRGVYAKLMADPSTAPDHMMMIGEVGAYYSFCLMWNEFWQQAGEVIEQAIARTAQNPDYEWLADDYSRLCLCYLRQGRAADADRALQMAYTHMGGMSPEARQAEAQMIEREYARAEGRFREALALSTLILDSGKPKPYLRWLYEDIANMYLERNQAGDRDAALGYLNKARDIATEMGAHGWVAHYDQRIAELQRS